MSITELVYDFAKETYEILSKIRNKDYCDTRLMFPKTRDEKTRVSEQELKQIFIEVFNRRHKAGEHDFLYAVETPTREKYTFSSGGSKKGQPKRDENGRSANIDMTIYDEKGTQLASIEFKAGNADKNDYNKDFCKLYNEETGADVSFFIQLIDNWDAGTKENIRRKYKAALEGEYKKGGVDIKIYTLFLKNGEGVKVGLDL